MSIDIQSVLDGKWEEGFRPADLYRDPIRGAPAEYVGALIAGLGAESRRVQNGCAELVSLLSEDTPELLLPHVGLFLEGLGAKHAVVLWEAACTLGNLARADKDGRVLPGVPGLLRCLRADSIVLQGHALRALVKIARAFPDEGPRVFEAVSEAEAAGAFPGSRAGYIVEAMEAFAEDPRTREQALGRLEAYAASPEASVVRKAKSALAKVAGTKEG